MDTRTPLRAMAAAAATALALTACGQTDDDTVAAVPTDETQAGDAADDLATDLGATTSDVRFVQQMIPHHEGAIAMADLVRDRTDRPELRQLADEIVSVQASEIDQLDGMLERMDAAEAPLDGEMDHGAMGMTTQEEMAALAAAEGEQFDRLFVETMIEHHQGAIDMAEQVLAEGQDAEVAGLAEAVIAAQQAEIEQLRAWQQEWGL